jgi:hypothetical protein
VPAGLSFFLAPSWPWLIPGLVFTGLSMTNNPAWKSYIVLKSEPARVARNISSYALPFVVVIVIALGLLVLLAVGAHGRGATRSHGGLGSGEGTD